MTETTFADVRMSFLECRAPYKRPIFGNWDKSSRIIGSVFDAFRDWNVSLENVSARQNPANLGELQFLFQLMQGKFVFSFGLGTATLYVWNPNWLEADLVTKVWTAGIDAIQADAKVEVERTDLTLGLHLAPRGRTVAEVTSRFIPPAIDAEGKTGLQGCGFVLYRADGSWQVDRSTIYPDALYVKLLRTVVPETPLDEVATLIRKEQADLLALLRLRIE